MLTSSGAGFTPSARTRGLPLVNQARTRDVITVHHWGPNGFDRGTVWYDGSHSAARQGASFAVDDYDGDGTDDLALVNDLSKGKFVIAVQLSSGTAFSEPEDWASYDLKSRGDSNPLLFPVNRFW